MQANSRIAAAPAANRREARFLVIVAIVFPLVHGSRPDSRKVRIDGIEPDLPEQSSY